MIPAGNIANSRIYRTFLVTLSILVFLFTPVTIFAQVDSSGVGFQIPMSVDSEVGDIICSYESGFEPCNSPYDPTVYGVIASTPAVYVEDTELDNPVTIVDSGVANVRVSTRNGPIVAGNFVTTSENTGVGQLANRNGYVLGTALESYEVGNVDEIGTIQVAINIHPAAGLTGARSDLLQVIRQGLATPLLEPLDSLRYLLASLMIVISFTLGLIYFGRASRTGIVAIGRNPLASRVIQLTVIINIVLTIVIVLVGLGIAYLILIL